MELTYLSYAVGGPERSQRCKQGERCTMEQLHRESIHWSRTHWLTTRSALLEDDSKNC
ncbi:MAG: hypothetical protein ACFFC7_10120 [Candidatus Hermodarchaeota archaeon]